MTDFAAIVKATRRSAKAIDRIAMWSNAYRRPGEPEWFTRTALTQLRRAQTDYAKAQAILAANPLPGDKE